MSSTTVVEKKPRKPRTKKADMILKKKEMEKQKLENNNAPKKRGRKPKGGKITKIEYNTIEPMKEIKNVIMHLKCKLSDLNNNDNFINSIEHYDPNINTIEPYHLENNFASIQNNTTEVDIKLPNVENNYEIIEQNNNNNNNEKSKSNQICRENVKKMINSKLKELEVNLNINNVNNKSACFWCTYEFNSNPIYIPSLFFKKKI